MRAKKELRPINFKTQKTGYDQRLTYYENIYDKNTIFPKPLEYSDLDNEFFKFVDEKINLSYNGEKFPTFKLYSNQRFSEYSQTWNHTDTDGNLLMNFKTINRDTNPLNGTNQGGYYNIPGNRKYTLLMKDVLDENGTESYEIYSMKQPFAVDLLYHVNIITNSFEKINEFNACINELFKSRQFYIFPNGHSIPLVVENIEDNTSYVIDERKFFVQSCTIKLMGYIIKKEDFKIDKKPKRLKIECSDNSLSNNGVDIEYHDECNVLIMNYSKKDKIEFEIDEDFIINDIKLNNIRTVKIFINDELYNINDIISFNKNDSIKAIINRMDKNLSSSIKFYSK